MNVTSTTCVVLISRLILAPGYTDATIRKRLTVSESFIAVVFRFLFSLFFIFEKNEVDDTNANRTLSEKSSIN